MSDFFLFGTIGAIWLAAEGEAVGREEPTVGVVAFLVEVVIPFFPPLPVIHTPLNQYPSVVWDRR